MRRYETVFILRPDLGEAQIRETVSRFQGLVASGGGELVDTEEWGFRELAYRIRGERRGYYVRLDYVAPGAVMNEVERNLKLSDSVLRFMSVMVDPEANAAALRSEVDARKRRAAEARAAAEAKAAQAKAEAAAGEAGEAEASAAAAEKTGTETQAEGAQAPEKAGGETQPD